MPHPDDAKGTKHKLICDGMEKLAEHKGWDIDKVYLWVDFAGALCFWGFRDCCVQRLCKRRLGSCA